MLQTASYLRQFWKLSRVLLLGFRALRLEFAELPTSAIFQAWTFLGRKASTCHISQPMTKSPVGRKT